MFKVKLVLQPSLATCYSNVNSVVTGIRGGKNILSKALTFMYINVEIF